MPSSIRIPLSKEKFAIVDGVDSHFSGYKWFCNCDGYAIRSIFLLNGKKGSVFLHHAIMGRSILGLQSDHINGDRRDCRRSNLRFVTSRQNQHNMKCHRGEKKKTSKYIGVTKDTTCRSWLSSIYVSGKQIRIGSFKTEEEAHDAYQKRLQEISNASKN